MSVQEKQTQENIVQATRCVDNKGHGGECFHFLLVSFSRLFRIASPILMFPLENMFGKVWKKTYVSYA